MIESPAEMPMKKTSKSPARQLRATAAIATAVLVFGLASCSTGGSTKFPDVTETSVLATSIAPATVEAATDVPDIGTLNGASQAVMLSYPTNSTATYAVANLRAVATRDLKPLLPSSVWLEIEGLWLDASIAILNSDDVSRLDEGAGILYSYGSRVQSEGRKRGLFSGEER